MSARGGTRAAVVAAAALAVAAGGLQAPAAATAEGCQLVRLPTQDGSPWGTVVDIELVDGRPVYLGSYDHVDADGSVHQRVVVWHGLDGEPVDVGPGLEHDVAFGLTAGGLVNGTSLDLAAGHERGWVRDLATGDLTWVPTSGGPAGARDVVPRRLNESGAVAGTGARGKGRARAADALAWDHYTGAPRALPALGRGALAFGINDQGDRAGFVEHQHLQADGRWTVYDPTVWYADGTVRTAARAGIDATVREINEAGQMAGATWWGFDPRAGHVEAAFWPSVDAVVGLGVLEEGAWSEAFGMDDGGSVVGRMERFDDGPVASPWGTVEHSFLWQGEAGAVRILPSLHAQQTGESDWRQWFGTHAAHAVHTGLRQVGAGTHAGFDADGVPVGAPTVFLDAPSCGELVATTHGVEEPQDLAEAQAVSAARATERRTR